jgi:ribosome maturation factor RimP
LGWGICPFCRSVFGSSMVDLDNIQAIAERVAASYGLEVVDVEMRGGGKHRMLRVVIDRLKPADEVSPAPAVLGVTHEDCANVSREMGTILDVEEAAGAGPYTLEVSSPGLDRPLTKPADYERFVGSLVKLTTREPVENNRHFQGRLERFADRKLTVDVTPPKKKNKPAPEPRKLEIELANVDKANLVPEI